MAKRAQRGNGKPRLTLGARKILRLLAQEGFTINAFARTHNLNRWTFERVLNGTTKRIDVDLVARLVKAFEVGVLDPLDFASRTVNEPDPGAEVAKKLRAVAS